MKLLPQWTQTTEDRCDIFMKLIEAGSQLSPFRPLIIYKTDYLPEDQYMYSVLTNELWLNTNINNCLTKRFKKEDDIQWKDFFDRFPRMKAMGIRFPKG